MKANEELLKARDIDLMACRKDLEVAQATVSELKNFNAALKTKMKAAEADLAVKQRAEEENMRWVEQLKEDMRKMEDGGGPREKDLRCRSSLV